MNYTTEEGMRTMISSFRNSELQSLLGAFGWNEAGRELVLKNRALDLLRNKPAGLNYQAYCTKIVELYRSMQTINYQHPQYPQQLMQFRRAALPQIMPKIQRGIYSGNRNIPGNNNLQYNYQQTAPRSIMLINQQLIMGVQDQMRGCAMNTAHMNNNIVAHLAMTNVKFKNLPFYEVIDEIIKPVILTGHENCSLPNIARGMRESQHKFVLQRYQVNYISLNRDTSSGKNEYLYQAQVRICLLDPGSTEISDFLPLGLHLRIFSKFCQLPPTAPNNRPGTEARRMPGPINCSNFLRLNPRMTNMITLNWIPDGKTYVWGMYLVKKLSSEFLLKKLWEKGARSSEETKNNIIRKLAEFDPDLSTTSYRVSLICPLGKIRMEVPAKSINCDHLQCFDASIFISMNEKKPTWMCPTCSKVCLYDDIQIESYFLDIVWSPSLPDSCEEIEILADGTWRVYEVPEKNINMDSASDDKLNLIDFVNLDDSDDDENNKKPESENPTEKIEIDKEPNPESKPESNPEISKENSDDLKSFFVYLTISDDEEHAKEKDKQENEAQAADATQPVSTSVDLKPQA